MRWGRDPQPIMRKDSFTGPARADPEGPIEESRPRDEPGTSSGRSGSRNFASRDVRDGLQIPGWPVSRPPTQADRDPG